MTVLMPSVRAMRTAAPTALSAPRTSTAIAPDRQKPERPLGAIGEEMGWQEFGKHRAKRTDGPPALARSSMQGD